MKDVDRRLVELASQQHQVFSRAQASTLGLSASTLCRRLQAGTLVACGPHSLCFPGVTLTWPARLQAGLLDLGPDALASGQAAAALHQLDGFEEGRLEYLVPRSQRRRTTNGLVTSSPEISKLDRVVVDGLPCVSGTRCVVQLLARASEREIGNALDNGTRRGITAPSVVRARLDELGTQGRAGVEVFNRVMESAGVQSWLERQFLALVRGAGLPRPNLQRTYRNDRVHVARVDFDFAPLPVIVGFGCTARPVSHSLRSSRWAQGLSQFRRAPSPGAPAK